MCYCEMNDAIKEKTSKTQPLLWDPPNTDYPDTRFISSTRPTLNFALNASKASFPFTVDTAYVEIALDPAGGWHSPQDPTSGVH